MKNIVLGLVISLLMVSCKQNTKTILVVGDSWAFLVCIDKSLQASLQNAGVKNFNVPETCLVTSKVGMRAEDWFGSPSDKATQLALKDPSVKVMYLSLGGNDMMNHWNKNLSSLEEDQIFSAIQTQISKIVQSYLAIRPDIKILISAYDFPRFTANHPIPAYRQAYEDMKSPSVLELNSAIVRLSQYISKIADQSRVFYIQHYGLTHYYFGNTEIGLKAFQTLIPSEISKKEDINQIGGYLSAQSDVQAMLHTGPHEELVDAFHLSKSAYEKLTDHCVSMYLKDWLQ